MGELKLNTTKEMQAEVWALYSKGIQQKDVQSILKLPEKVVAHYFIKFTATYTERCVNRQVQLKTLEDRLWQELETNPHSPLCYQLQWQYSNYELNK